MASQVASQDPVILNHGAEPITTASGQVQSNRQKDIRQYFRPVAPERRKDDIRAYFRPLVAKPARPGSGTDTGDPRDPQDRMFDGKPKEISLAEGLGQLDLGGKRYGSKTAAYHEQGAEEYRGRVDNSAIAQDTAETQLPGNALEPKVALGFGSAEARMAPGAVLQPQAFLTVPNLDRSKSPSFAFRSDTGEPPTKSPAYNQIRSSVLPGFDPTFRIASGELSATPLSPRIMDVVDHTLVPSPLEPKRPHSPSTISDLRLRIINAALEQDAKNSKKQLPAIPKIRVREEKKKNAKRNPSPLAQWQKYREEKSGSSAIAGSGRPGISTNDLKPLPPSDRSISMPDTTIVRIHSPRGPSPMPSIDHTLRSHSDRDVCMIVPCIQNLLPKGSSSLTFL